MSDWHNAERHAEKAHQFYEAGQWSKALDELKLALAVNPEQSDWHFGMGLTLAALQRYDEAATSFEQVLKLRGQDVEAMLHLAVALIRSSHNDRAITVLESVSEIDPDCEPSYCYRIAAYTQLGDHDTAEQMFYLAQQINENCPQCYDHVALSLALRGDLDRAIWCWQRALKIDPHYPDAQANLARAHWQLGQLDRASQLFILQLREDPGDTSTLLQLGTLLIETGKQAQAREKFNRVLELDPTVTDAYLHLGELSLATGQTEAAAAELEMAGRLDPARAGIQLCLAKVALQRGEKKQACAHLLAETERCGHNPLQALQLAQMLIEMRLPQPAVRVLSKVIKGSPDTPPLEGDSLGTAQLYLGLAWMLEGKTQAGISQCRRALKLQPENTAIMQQLVLTHLQERQLRRARYWLNRAIKLQPRDRELRQLQWRLLNTSIADLARRVFRPFAGLFLR